MTKTGRLFVGLALAHWLAAGSAYADNDQSWVSANGTGSSCTRAAPCGNFQAAHNATTAGGVISVLNSGNYSGVVIIKYLTIRAEGADGGATIGPGPGTWVQIQAAASDVISLEGLHFQGSGAVDFVSGGQLNVVRCVIDQSRVAGSAGIRFRPNSAGKLSVTDTVIRNMGSGTGGGIIVNPASGGSAQVAIERVTVNGNAFGIAADGTGSTAGINMTIVDSMIAGNTQDGIVAVTPGGGAPIGLYLKNTKSVNNNIGIRSIGANVTVRLDGSSVIGNGTGLSFSGGGALLTFGNNAVRANGSDGTFSGSVGLQ